MRPSRNLCWFFILSAFSVLSVVPSNHAIADEKTAADLLPDTTVVYAEVSAPSELVDAVMNHPLHKRLQKLDEYKELTEENADFLKARAGLGIFEFVVGRDWDQAIEDIAGDGLYFAVDAETEGVIAITKAPKAEALADIRDRIIKAAKDDAERKGKDVDFEEIDYRGITVYKADGAIAGVFKNWLIVTNKPDLGRSVADRILDGGDDTLAKSERFIEARKGIAGAPAAWAYANVEALRDAGLAKELYQEKSNNFGAELFIAGILAALQEAPSGTAALYVEDQQLRLAASVPHDPASVPQRREFFFGPEGKGSAPAPLQVKNQLLAVTAHRDVGEMWRRRSDLFDENVNAELATADSNLSTVFAGLDFGREVLGALQPQVQIIAAGQDFADKDVRQPKIKLPAGAMVFQLKEPEKMQRQLKVSFQSLIGLTNLGAGQNELPQLELATEKTDAGQIISATYENLEEDADVSNDIIYNFSPALAFTGDYFIIASTRDLAVELMEQVEGAKPQAAGERIVNTSATIDSDALSEILNENRDALVAQNMLENGHTKAEAEKEIGALFTLLRFAGDTSLQLTTEKDTLRLELSLGLEAD